MLSTTFLVSLLAAIACAGLLIAGIEVAQAIIRRRNARRIMNRILEAN